MLTAARLGAYKAHFVRREYEDNLKPVSFAYHSSLSSSVCVQHQLNPPQLFNIHRDPSERFPLDIALPAHAAALAAIQQAVSPLSCVCFTCIDFRFR